MTAKRIPMLTVALLFALGAAALAGPAAGQTVPPPEATPEYWPLSFDPVTVSADPGAFTLVFAASARCVVSPDGSVALLIGHGVYDIATGQKRFSLTGHPEMSTASGVSAFNPVAPLLQIRGYGVYNYETGERVIETRYERGLFSPDGRWFLDYKIVYDLQTLQPVAEIDREGDGERNYAIAAFSEDGSKLRVLSQEAHTFVPVDTETWRMEFDIARFNDLISREGARLLSDSLLVVPAEGIYDAATGEKRPDNPAPDALDWYASFDGSLLAAVYPDEIRLYSLNDGALVQRIPEVGVPAVRMFGTPAIQISSDNRTMIVSHYTEVRSGGSISFLPISAAVYDIETGERSIFIAPLKAALWFMPDPRFVNALQDGVYDIATGAKVLALSDPETEHLRMTQAGDMAFVTRKDSFTVYDPETWEQRYTLPGDLISVSPDRRWIMAGDSGVYDATTGSLVLETPDRNLTFSTDGRLLISTPREPCAIYSVPVQE